MKQYSNILVSFLALFFVLGCTNTDITVADNNNENTINGRYLSFNDNMGGSIDAVETFVFSPNIIDEYEVTAKGPEPSVKASGQACYSLQNDHGGEFLGGDGNPLGPDGGDESENGTCEEVLAVKHEEPEANWLRFSYDAKLVAYEVTGNTGLEIFRKINRGLPTNKTAAATFKGDVDFRKAIADGEMPYAIHTKCQKTDAETSKDTKCELSSVAIDRNDHVQSVKPIYVIADEVNEETGEAYLDIFIELRIEIPYVRQAVLDTLPRDQVRAIRGMIHRYIAHEYEHTKIYVRNVTKKLPEIIFKPYIPSPFSFDSEITTKEQELKRLLKQDIKKKFRDLVAFVHKNQLIVDGKPFKTDPPKMKKVEYEVLRPDGDFNNWVLEFPVGLMIDKMNSPMDLIDGAFKFKYSIGK